MGVAALPLRRRSVLTSGGYEPSAIRRASIEDLEGIKQLADQHRHELGFVLAPSLARSIERNELIVVENSEGTVAFVDFHHRRDNQTTLYHIVVHSDHRRQSIGRQLIDELIRDAKEHDKEFIQLKCPVDLEANKFYESQGFCRAHIQPNKHRDLAIWRLTVRAPSTPESEEFGNTVRSSNDSQSRLE